MLGIKTGLDISSVNKTKQEFTKMLADMQSQANRNPIRINVQNTTNQINSINNSMNTLGNSANNTGGSFKNLGSSLGSLTNFYMRWISVSSMVNIALAETKKAIGFAFEQDTRVRNISMITGESREDVQKYTKDWNNLALELKQSTSVVAQSNEEWARAGSKMSEIAELTKMTVKTSEIAGSSIKDTTAQAIALKNAYSMTNGELKQTLDGVVKMDNVSSTSTDRLLRSLLVTSSVAKEAKVPVDWLVASLTTVQSKSKQTAESVGKNFRNIFLNMTKMTSSKDQVSELNKAEDQLNKLNISMRSNSTTFRSADKVLNDLSKTWGTLNEIQKAELGKSLAGKENINTFNILMQNQAETLKNLNNIKQASGSVDKGYEEHLKSANGALGYLKATLESLYATIVNGDILKKVLTDLTNIVKVVRFLITDGADLGKVWLGIVIAAKNFKLVEAGIMACVTAFKYLRAFGAESLVLLSVNPIILGFIALSAVIATITFKQYQHSKQVKDLEQTYTSLSKAMEEMDSSGIKENTETLKESQKELDKLIKMANVKMDMGFGVKDDSGERNLKEYIKTLEEAGFTVDIVSGKILDLEIAESNVATSDTLTSIQNKTNATIEEATGTQDLISQYMSLSQQENLSSEKKKLLSGLTNQLVGKVDGLTVSTDKNGNAIISNVGFLGKQIDVLELLKQQAIITANAQIESAINASSAIHNGTIQSLDDMKATIKSQQILASALSKTSAGKGGFFDAQLSGINMDIANLEDSVDKIESLKNKFNMKAPSISGIGSSNATGYKPSAEIDKVKESTKGLTEADKQLTSETKRATNATKDYETAMKSLSIQLKAQDISLGKLNENSSKYRAGLEKKAELLKADIKLTEQSIITNTKNAKALVNIEGKPNTSNTISSKNVASSAGQAVVDEAKKYLGTPYVWGGTNQEGFDCSGLVQFVYKKLGKDISRTTTTQINEGSKIAKKDLQVGDTVFFGNPSEPHHEGIYVGDGKYLHAPQTGDVVKISNLNSRSDFAGARRMVSGGGITSTPSNIQGFMGDSTTDNGSDKILTEIENQKSHLVDVREELDKLKIEVLKSKVGVFDEQVAIYDKYINLNKAKSERFEVGSIGHTKAMNDELQAMTNKYINLTKKTQLLNEEIKSGGYDEKTVSDLKTQLLDTDSAYLDIYNNIRTLTKEIYANAFAENDKLLAKFESDAKKVDDSISLLGTIDTVKEMEKQLSLITDKKVIKLSELVKINHEMEALNEELKTINSTTTQGEIRLKAVTDRLKSLAETQVNLEISITTDEESINSIPEQIKSKLMEEANFVKSMQDKIGEVIKKRYEEEQKLAKENLDLKIKAREKEHKNIIAKLNEEKNAYKEFYELKLQDLDREKGQSQYESKISDLVKAKMILQKEYDSLLMDDSLGSKARRSELKEELSNSQEGINREQYDRNIELQKDNISALLKAEENKTDKEIKGKEELYDKDKEAFDISLKQIEKKYENLLKAENIYRESTKILIDNQYTDEEGHIIKLTELMTKFTDEWGDGLSAVGDKIKTELLDNIAKAQGYLGVESKTTKDERTQIKDMTDMSVYIDGIVYSLSEINGNPDKYKDIVENAKVVYVKGMNDEIWDDKASNANSTNKSMIESSEKKRIKEMKVMSAYVDGAIYSLDDLNSNTDKYKNITDKAKVVYIKGMDGDIWDGKTNKKESFSEGGVIDYTGDAKVHGSPNNSEVVFNSKQALGLYNFVKTMPVQSFNRNAISPPQFSQQSMESVVHLSVDNLINVNGNVDKESLPTLKEISKFVIGDIQKELNKTGIYRRV